MKMSVVDKIKEHAVLTYFTLTIAISWGLVISIVGLDGIIGTTQEQEDLLYTVVFTLLAGPIVAGLTMIGFINGKAGYKDFIHRLTKLKVKVQWYVIALLTAPIVGIITLFILVPLSEMYLPAIFTSNDKLSLVLTGLMIGLSAGIFEEIGWTGFAVPELRKKHDVFTTGLVVGIVWGIWHYITALWGSGNDLGDFTMSLFLPMMTFYIIVLPAFRMLMVWVYDQTHSLFIAIIMHGSLTGNVIYMLLSPELSADGVALTFWYIVFAIDLWIIVGTLIISEKRKVSTAIDKPLAISN